MAAEEVGMSGVTNPCIVYLRQRESNRRANALSLTQQTAVEAEVIRKEGWTLVGGFRARRMPEKAGRLLFREQWLRPRQHP